MKNQYFGDINDYKKYGLLRLVNNNSSLNLVINWMLTPDDSSNDGKLLNYLSNPTVWRNCDPILFDYLKQLLNNNSSKQVNLIKKDNFIIDADFYSDIVPDNKIERSKWFDNFISKTSNTDIVFCDPDNGLEIKSKPIGRKNSSKYIFWNEITKLWENGSSLIIYQHFPRKPRFKFISMVTNKFRLRTPNSLVVPFETSYVIFLVAIQPKHKSLIKIDKIILI